MRISVRADFGSERLRDLMSDFVRESFTSLPTKQQKWPVLLAVWATFFFYGAIAAPVPGVNEPHYLCKSKHFWQPAWCERDFFLASPEAFSPVLAILAMIGAGVKTKTSDSTP